VDDLCLEQLDEVFDRCDPKSQDTSDFKTQEDTIRMRNLQVGIVNDFVLLANVFYFKRVRRI